MRLRLTLIDLTGDPSPRQVLIDAPPGSTAADLGPLLASSAADGPLSLSCVYAGGAPLQSAMPIGLPPLVDGCVLTLGGAGVVPPRRVAGLLELHVIEGPDCGQVVRLPPGRRSLGRAAEAGVRLEDPDVSRLHAYLDVRDDGVHVSDAGSSNGTTVDGHAVGEGPVLLPVGARLALGSSTLVVRVPALSPAAVSPDREGRLLVNRSPRIRPPTAAPEIRLPAPPQRREGIRLPVLAALIPLLVSLVLARLTGSATMLLFGLMSPLLLLGSYVSDRRAGRKGAAQERREYETAEAAAQGSIAEALAREVQSRRRELPDRAELLLTAAGPTSRLWERRRGDDDLLTLRLGTRSLTSRILVVDADGGRGHPDVAEVPVPVPLAELGVLAVSGPRELTLGVVRALVADVCGWHSPVDVSLVVLAASTALASDWAWTAQLPHTLPARGEPCHNLVGTGADSAQLQRRVGELVQLVDDRRATSAPTVGTRGGAWPGPCTVVLLDGAQRLRQVPGVARLLEQGPAVGVFALCVDDDDARLPVEARATVRLGPASTDAALLVGGAAPLTGIVADRVSARWAERFARSLAPLRDATPNGDDGGLPDSVRLVELLSGAGAAPSRGPAASAREALYGDPRDPAVIARAWARVPRSTRATIGVTPDGAYELDLSRDGPHVLVGGTTGSGKSELLLTLIASLALANRPDQLSFVLVDYKGGAAFQECAGLPHTAGVVTDLDPHLTQRALTSLTAELRRRERLLRDHFAKDLQDYQSTAGPDDPVIPRLVLVIDEFRMLAEELPAFLDGLVRIAALGRSLGVHLVLATQRPAGIVSAEIKANVNLRIALRVRDRTDSEDVVGAPDAAHLSDRHPGRALARTGGGPLVAFQSARVGGAQAPPDDDRLTWRDLPWEEVGDPPEPCVEDAPAPGRSDLAAIAAACRSAARDLGVAHSVSPWLPPLPAVVPVDALTPVERSWSVPIGLLDSPAEQSQRPLTWDLERDGHLAIAGMSRSGRSTLLRTVAAGIADRLAPSDVHVYALDGGSGALACLTALPHAGAVVSRSEPERLERLLARLHDEMERRQGLLARLGHGSLAEQRAQSAPDGKQPLPYLVLLVDGWEGLTATLESIDHGRPLDTLLGLLREGAGVGLRAVVAGDRSVLLSKVAAVVPDKLVLAMADPTDLMLAGIAARDVPAELPPGRALRVVDGAEVQLAVLGTDLAGSAQVAQVLRRAEAARARWPFTPSGAAAPMRVESLPASVSVRDLSEAADVSLAGPNGATRAGWAVVGVGGDDLRTVGIDLSEPGTAALVAGPAGSGRSTALATMACWLADHGTPVALVTARRSPLEGLAGAPGVVGLAGPTDARPLRDWAGRHTGLVVLVDDAELLLDSPVEQELVQLLRRTDASPVSVVCAGTSAELAAMFRGITTEVRKQGRGLLLSPTTFSDGDLFGLRLGRGRRQPPGRGLLIERGRSVAVQVATPDLPAPTSEDVQLRRRSGDPANAGAEVDIDRDLAFAARDHADPVPVMADPVSGGEVADGLRHS